MSWQIGLIIAIRHCGIHFLVHHYRDCKPAAQKHIVACRRPSIHIASGYMC